MRERIANVLEIVTSARELEAAWLNTLSLLEYIGARKIMRTVAETHPSAAILEHIATETRHAVMFKKLACSVAGRPVDTYFSRLDSELSAWAADIAGEDSQLLNYLLVSTVAERRVMMLYPTYREVTATDSVRDALREIIVDEKSERVAMEERCLAEPGRRGIKSLATPEAVESAFFIELLTALETSVVQASGRMSA